MISGGRRSFQSANLSANADFPIAKALIIAITIGFIVFIACLMVYLFCQIYDLMDISTTDTTTTAAAATTTTSGPATSSCHVGINPKVFASVPVFVHSSSSRKEKIECAICLVEIKNGEKGRLLSRCGHGFHAECIDMWLYSHSTCPLCRSNVGSEFTEPPI